YPHGIPMKAEWGGKRFAVRILVAIVVLLVLLAVVLGLALETASVDPYGMATARPLTVSDVSNIEPLYGDVWTPNAAVSWSPNGTEIVTTSNVRYAIWDVATHSRLWLDTNASTWGDSVDWSPDGHLLAFGSNAGPSIYDAASHERLYQPPSVEWDQRGVAWSHSGDRIAAANLDGCATVLSRS